MTEYYICDQKSIETKLKSLIKTGTSEDGWEHYYYDKNNTEEWLLTRYDSSNHGGGFPVLKKLPQPSMDKLIELALTSNLVDDIRGASIELSEREKYNKVDFRHTLIDKLALIDLNHLNDIDRQRLNIIITECHLANPVNIRDIVGKHWLEIQKDAEYFKSISETAKVILAAVNQ